MRGVLGSELQVVNAIRKFTILAREVILELQCQSEMVTVEALESRCYTSLLVKWADKEGHLRT